MGTITQGPTTSGDAQFAQSFAPRISLEMVADNKFLQVLTGDKVINIENKLSEERGGSITMYNRPKLDTKLSRGDVDRYSTAKAMSSVSRQLNIDLVSETVEFPMPKTQSQQFTPYMIDEGKQEQIIDVLKASMTASIINQACGNTATSITQTALSSTAFTGNDLLTVTGNNAAVAPSRWYWAGSAATARTTDASISGQSLSIASFMTWSELLNSQPTNGAIFQSLRNSKDGHSGIVLLPESHVHQMLNDTGTAYNFKEVIYNQISSGKNQLGAFRSFTVPGINFKFVQGPDSYFPRGVNDSTGAEVALSRRGVILGHNALDMAFGQGYTNQETGEVLPGINVSIDMNHKKNNKVGYCTGEVLYGTRVTTTDNGSGGTQTLSTLVFTANTQF